MDMKELFFREDIPGPADMAERWAPGVCGPIVTVLRTVEQEGLASSTRVITTATATIVTVLITVIGCAGAILRVRERRIVAERKYSYSQGQ